MKIRCACLALVFAMTACKPSATDDYAERGNFLEPKVSHTPSKGETPSPDTAGAIWADTASPMRIIYGVPGQTPLLALACETPRDAAPQIKITRFAAADPRAKALFALIGNGHVARLPVDAAWNGQAWLWQGAVRADDPSLEVLIGPRPFTATLPGAGKINLSPSPRLGQLVENCRQPAAGFTADLAQD